MPLSRVAVFALACIVAGLLALAVAPSVAGQKAYADDMTAQEDKSEDARLLFEAAKVVQVGKPDIANGSVAHFGFAFGYADTVASGTVHTWKEYDTVGKTEADFFGKSMGATYDMINLPNDDEQGKLSALRKAIDEGHPVVLHTKATTGNERWVTIVGYQNITDPNKLTLANFVMYDPWGDAIETPESADIRGYTLLDDETKPDLYIAKASVNVVKARDFYQYDYGMIALNDGVKAEWRRTFGLNAPGTMATIADSTNFSGYKTVVLATIDGYWDALSASGLAGAYACPVLLTEKNVLSEQVRYEIKRMAVQEVIIVGGTASVSEAVEDTLKNDVKVSVKRLAGENAAETAARVFSDDTTRWNDTAVIATVNSYHDALSIAPFAFAKKAPIFLTIGTEGQLDNTTWQVSDAFDNIVIVGGTASVAANVEEGIKARGTNAVRLAGDNAYDTSLKIANWCVDEQGFKLNQVGVATGAGYWDALAAGAACGVGKHVLLLASDENTSAIDKFVKPHAADITMGIVYGGNASVSDDVFAKLMKAA